MVLLVNNLDEKTSQRRQDIHNFESMHMLFVICTCGTTLHSCYNFALMLQLCIHVTTLHSCYNFALAVLQLYTCVTWECTFFQPVRCLYLFCFLLSFTLILPGTGAWFIISYVNAWTFLRSQDIFKPAISTPPPQKRNKTKQNKQKNKNQTFPWVGKSNNTTLWLMLSHKCPLHFFAGKKYIIKKIFHFKAHLFSHKHVQTEKKIIPNKSNTTVIESIWSLRNLMEKLEVNLAFSNIQEFLYTFNFFFNNIGSKGVVQRKA